MKHHTILNDMQLTNIFYSHNIKSICCDFQVLQDRFLWSWVDVLYFVLQMDFFPTVVYLSGQTVSQVSKCFIGCCQISKEIGRKLIHSIVKELCIVYSLGKIKNIFTFQFCKKKKQKAIYVNKFLCGQTKNRSLCL